MGPIQLYQSYLLLYFICSTRWQCRFSPYLCESFFVTLTIKSSSCKKDTPLANTFLTKRCLFLFFLICHINSHKPLYPMAAQTMLRCRLPSPTGNRAPPRPSASPRAQPQGAPPHAALAPERPQGHAVVPRVVGSGRGLSGLIFPPFLLHFGEITAAEHFPTERASRGAVPLEDQQGFASEPFVSIAHCGRHVAGREPSLAPSKTLEIRLPSPKLVEDKCSASSPYRSSVIRLELALSFVRTGGGKARGVVQLHGAAGTKTNNGSNNALIKENR